uniref:PBPb domain-containing protein n=2 Tax=Bursaphelenchus xylophilus TaxID=6326 RepID=A0A1I7RKE6_BURXY
MNLTYENRPLRVLFPNRFPYIRFGCIDGANKVRYGCTYQGLMVEIFTLLAKRLGYRLQITINNDLIWNGNLSTILEESDVDALGIPLPTTKHPEMYADLTLPIYKAEENILIYLPGHMDDSWWNMFSVFDRTVWILLLVMFTIKCVFCCLVNRAEVRLKTKKSLSGLEVVWELIQLQLFQSPSTNFTFVSARVPLTLFSLLQTTLLLGILTSWFLSSLLRVPNRAAFLKSDYIFREITRGRRELISQGPTSWIYTNTGQEYIRLTGALNGTSIRKVPPEEILKKVREEGALLFTETDTRGYYEARKYCDIFPSTFMLPPIEKSIMLRKDSPLTAKFNKLISEDYRRFNGYYRKYSNMNQNTRCNQFKIGQPLELQVFLGLFMICASLSVGACCVFVVEMICMNTTFLSKQLRVLFPNHFPYVNSECINSNGRVRYGCAYPGLMVDILNFIAKRMGYTLYAKLDNDQIWRGNVSALWELPDIDTIGVPLQRSMERLKYVDFTKSMYEAEGRIMIYTAADLDDGWWNMFKVYDKTSWIMMLVMLIIECIFLSAVNHLEARACFKKHVRNVDVVWNVVKIQFFQSASSNFYFTSGKLSLWWFALLQSTLMLGVLTSWFLSSLLKTPTYSNLLAEDYIYKEIGTGERKLIAQGSTSWFYTETGATFSKLAKVLNGSFAERVLPSDIIHRMRNEGALLFTALDKGSYAEVRQYCDIQSTNIVFPPIDAKIMLAKNSSLLPWFNDIIVHNQKRLQNLYRKYTTIKVDSICENFKIGDELKVKSFTGLFIICGLLLAISCCVFIIEMMVDKNILI